MASSLSKEQRNQLAKVTSAARSYAESAAKAALENLAVHESKPRSHMKDDAKKLRNRLRARGRALGDVLESDKSQGIARLIELVAYENWHRLLFTRFLTENNLLITDKAHDSVPVTLADCEELAKDLGARDGQELACRFASALLPGVFRADDPALELRISIDDEVKLRNLLQDLTSDIFLASDSLGWTYQFWQADKKDKVNAGGNKIGADELPSVTQLFTEDYMVDFLLDNTLGAWWAGKVAEASIPAAASHKVAEASSLWSACTSEEECRKLASLPGIPWKYLRFIKDNNDQWKPASGTFDGWPKSAKELKCLDPCMGSGHFVVAMFERLVGLRMAEEKLDEAAAVSAVIQDNLFGLEIDPRCTQIAAFNLALAAWRRVGHCALPAMNLACSGLAPNTEVSDWLAIAGDNEKLKNGMERLYRLFENAPVLGSLINPRLSADDMYVADYYKLQPLLEKALTQETKDDNAHEMAVTARGLTKAAEILAGQFTLVATNVPYLGRLKQNEVMKTHLQNDYAEGKSDLATAFILRCLELCEGGGSASLVTPQNWLFLATYKKYRQKLLNSFSWNSIARLGTRAFETITGEVVNVALLTLTNCRPAKDFFILGLDVADAISAAEKRAALLAADGYSIRLIQQSGQLLNPDAAINFDGGALRKLLSDYAHCYQGACTLDIERFRLRFFEVYLPSVYWSPHMSSPDAGMFYSGLSFVSANREQGTPFHSMVLQMQAEGSLGGCWQAGKQAWGSAVGVACSWMNELPANLYTGCVFDNMVAVIVPNDPLSMPAVWAFCSSSEFNIEVRKINKKMQVANSTLTKVPFDLAHWQKVAAEKYPHGLPKPFSSDPTQWLFNGHPNQKVAEPSTPNSVSYKVAEPSSPNSVSSKVAEASSLWSSNKTQEDSTTLQITVARLLGYQWPRQTGSSFPDCPALKPDGLEEFADTDGIVCLQPLRGEQPAAHRLREILNHSFSEKGKAYFDEKKLIASSGLKGSKATNLEDWLRDDFFEQHCTLFHHRPFIWHIWDGRKDGFHALLNYHKLDHETLKKLTYSHLGDWIRQQSDDAKADKPGAAERLGAAEALQKELEFILKGQPPYDIFVRWKSLQQQAKGWHPDLNDGVRMNIRPLMLAMDMGKKGAGVLRAKPNIKWDKDRGKEPERDKKEFPWFWCNDEPEEDPKPGSVFAGNRFNNVHLSLEFKTKGKKSN